MRASLMLAVGFFPGFLFAGSFAYSQTTEQPWIESGADKAAIARHSKSPDGRNALAWVVAGDQGTIDWSLLQSDPDGFYEKYEVREF